jgi:hypothetical protein
LFLKDTRNQLKNIGMKLLLALETALETLSVNNAWAGLVIFLLGDPHLLEGRE